MSHNPCIQPSTDVITLTQELVRFPSVTPDSSKALDWAEDILTPLGFTTERLVLGEGDWAIDNLYATWGSPEQRLMFCGHVDVVPTGAREDWKVDPFSAEIIDGVLFGRGAVDMKGNIAAFLAALRQVITQLNFEKTGIAVLLTGDEEADAIYGVRAVMPVLVARGEKWIGCLTGEPTSIKTIGDNYKHGRRGSINGQLTIHGIQGHTGYPSKSINPAHIMVDALSALRALPLDEGSADFEPSWLAITSIDIGNPANNVIPAKAIANMNFRYNTFQTSAGLSTLAENTVQDVLNSYAQSDLSPEQHANIHQMRMEWVWKLPSEPFLTSPENKPARAFLHMIDNAITKVTGKPAQCNTAGGTSDSRFIHPHCPVVDFGLCGVGVFGGMHQANESVATKDLIVLQDIYTQVILMHAQQKNTLVSPE